MYKIIKVRRCDTPQWYFAQTKFVHFCQLLIAIMKFKIEFRGRRTYELFSQRWIIRTAVLSVMLSTLVQMFSDVSEETAVSILYLEKYVPP
jgi:hypothetical protein